MKRIRLWLARLSRPQVRLTPDNRADALAIQDNFNTGDFAFEAGVWMTYEEAVNWIMEEGVLAIMNREDKNN